MAGQTQREGPWESNLGLEPEWDGAFGQFWCHQLPDLKFAGSLVHENGSCYLKLIGINLYPKEDTTVRNFFTESKTIVWNGSVRRSSEDNLDHISIYAMFVGYSRPYSRSSSVSLTEVKLLVQWLICGQHIDSLEDVKLDNLYLVLDLLPFVVPRLEIEKQLGSPQDWLQSIASLNIQDGYNTSACVDSHCGTVEVTFLSGYVGETDESIFSVSR